MSSFELQEHHFRNQKALNLKQVSFLNKLYGANKNIINKQHNQKLII